MGESATERVLYGIRQVRIKNLLSDGSADPSATEYDLDSPQRCGYDFVYNEGETVELRGGDDLVAIIEEADKLKGVDMTLDFALIMPEVDEAICGGVATPASSKWESPKDDSEEPYPFEMTIWVANYTQSSSKSVQDGFMKFTFPFVTGRRASGEKADRAFAGPSYALECRKNESNASDIKSAIAYEKVASIT